MCGADIEPSMLALAQDRFAQNGLSDRVSFQQAGFDAAPLDGGQWDGVMGRRVLMYQAEPAAALSALRAALRPGGAVLLHEHDMTMADDPRADLPLHREVRSWLRAMLEAEHAHLAMGHDLYAAYVEAGLEVERIEARANILTPATDYPIEGIVRAVWPRLVAQGVVDDDPERIEGLDARLKAERQAANASLIWELVFWGVARNPSS
ncbi:methyltransferase domain-containing protein [Oceanicaulis sp.]|uniref:methyltransferase domain-containing protein n=1 Tax=Oceanicaulis sp. TaxID=1924941 RepID=UPI003F716B89